MRDFRLEGPRLVIRRAHPGDAGASFRWFADPEVTRYPPLAGRGFLPMERVTAYLERAAVSDRPELAVGIELRDGRIEAVIDGVAYPKHRMRLPKARWMAGRPSADPGPPPA